MEIARRKIVSYLQNVVESKDRNLQITEQQMKGIRDLGRESNVNVKLLFQTLWDLLAAKRIAVRFRSLVIIDELMRRSTYFRDLASKGKATIA